MSTEPLADQLAAARESLDAAEDAVADVGEDRLRRLESAGDNLRSLFSRFEDRATGSGDFRAYLEFQEAVAQLDEELDDDLPHSDVFTEISDLFQKRRLSESDFEQARAMLEPVDDLVGRLDERAEAMETYRQTRRDVEERRREIDDEIARLERVVELAETDLDAPVEDLKEPIETYNEAVQDAFSTFKQEASAREVLQFVEASRAFPLAALDAPPAELTSFIKQSAVGTESIATLLEWADYSRSKLDHYVDEPQTFLRIVSGNRTYLSRLDASALLLDWPPAPADELRWRIDELVSVVNRFADNSVVEHLEQVGALARDEPRFEHLRAAAVARKELTADERERVAAGIVKDDLATLEAERERLTQALDDY